MLKILKSDLNRIVKDKIFIVLCALGLFFALVTPTLLFIIFVALEKFNLSDLDILGSSFTGKEIFFNCFAPGNNFGLILPVLVSVIILKDFSYGTIRNKIISGYSRTKIYLSYLLSTVIIVFIFIIAYATVSLLFSLLLTPYQHTPFVWNDLWYFLLSVLFIFLGYMMISALITFVGVFLKNIPLTIVIYIILTLGFTMVSTFLQLAIPLLEYADKKVIYNILNILDNCNIYGALTNVIGHISSYELHNILYLTIVPIVLSGVFTGCGILIFKKRDI